MTYDLYKKYGDMRLLDTPICGEAGAHALCPALTPPAQQGCMAVSTPSLQLLCRKSQSSLAHDSVRDVRSNQVYGLLQRMASWAWASVRP